MHGHIRRCRSCNLLAITLFCLVKLLILPYASLAPLPSRTLEERRPLPPSGLPANPPSVVLPHCSKAILTVSHSSRQVRRSTPSLPQLGLNIGVGQTVCFRLQDPSTDESISVQEQRRPFVPEALFNAITKTPVHLAPLAAALQIHNPSILQNFSINYPDRTTTTSQTLSIPGHHLHTLTLVELEQYYAITERYRFAVPQVETNCICECNAQSPTCQADEYKYGECSSSTDQSSLHHVASSEVCHRTFFANQPSNGCASSSPSSSSSDGDGQGQGKQPRLCCHLRFTPYGNRVFTALRLEAPTTSAVLRYSVYAWNGDWMEVERRKVRVQLDGSVHNTFLQEENRLKLSVLGLGARSGASELEPGMYLVENLAVGSYGEVISQPVNRITEHDFHKLGWFRLNERGQPFVQSGDIFLDKIHHARAENCAEQKFRSVLEASYYVNKWENNISNGTSALPFPLAQPLKYVHRWIRSAKVFDPSERQVVVTAGEGINLDLTLTTTRAQEEEQEDPVVPPTTIAFVHNSSQLTDFTATILVDHFSNSLLNLTVYGAKGVLNGYIRQLEEWNGEDIDSFSVTIPTLNHKTALNSTSSVLTRIKPYPINSIQVVCLRPDDTDQSKELCRPVQSIQFELEMGVSAGREWTTGIGKCPECNAISVDGFMKYLNPANWTKGVHSVSDALMLASDIFGYIFVFLVVYIVLTKIVVPLVGCFLCPMSIFYRRSKK